MRNIFDAEVVHAESSDVVSRSVSTYGLKRVKSRHREIMRRLVCGQTQRQIAQDMTITDARLSIIINSPLFRVELKRMERDIYNKAVEKVGDVPARLVKLQGPAVDVLEKVVLNSDGRAPLKLQKDTAIDILELAGIKKGRVNDDGMNDFAQFITEAFSAAKERALERMDHALDNGSVIDIDVGADTVASTDAEELAAEEFLLRQTVEEHAEDFKETHPRQSETPQDQDQDRDTIANTIAAILPRWESSVVSKANGPGPDPDPGLVSGNGNKRRHTAGSPVSLHGSLQRTYEDVFSSSDLAKELENIPPKTVEEVRQLLSTALKQERYDEIAQLLESL